MPQEIIDAIVLSIGPRLDILALAMASSYFFRLMLPNLQHAIIHDRPSWAGDRMICHGDYADGVPKSCADAATLMLEKLTADLATEPGLADLHDS
jgi:hypothetical protein